MLVLSRRKDERIVIDGSIIITVIEIKGEKVRLGIEAPIEVPVHRYEVHAAIAAEQRSEESESAGGRTLAPGLGEIAPTTEPRGVETPVETPNTNFGPS